MKQHIWHRNVLSALVMGLACTTQIRAHEVDRADPIVGQWHPGNRAQSGLSNESSAIFRENGIVDLHFVYADLASIQRAKIKREKSIFEGTWRRNQDIYEIIVVQQSYGDKGFNVSLKKITVSKLTDTH
jgi:hypothetical protein